MFKSNKQSAEIITTGVNDMNHIAENTIIKGDMHVKGSIRFDGQLEGTIICEAKVVLGASGKILGKIKSNSADVSGTIEGLIEIKEDLVLRKTAKISAEVFTSGLIIESGAILNGTTKMNKPAVDNSIPKIQVPVNGKEKVN